MSTRKIHTWSGHAVSSTITSRNITQHRKHKRFFQVVLNRIGILWEVLGRFGWFCWWFWVVLAGFGMNKVKNLRYNRWLIYKQPRQEPGLCCFPFERYLLKCVIKIYRALYGDAMFVSFWETQIWRP